MNGLTHDGQQMVDSMAARHNVSGDAVLHLLNAMASGGGRQAQFNHPELGGMGQWSQGGMIMVGDMFNQGLKYRVDALCNDLAQALGAAWPFAPVPGGQPGGWPEELGLPASTGAQNSMRYAVFPATRRLAINRAGQVTVYDTGDHWITGFSQQQGGDQSLTLTSQHGPVRLEDLPIVRGGAQAGQGQAEQGQATAFIQAPPSVEAAFSQIPPADITPLSEPVAPAQRAPSSDEEIFARLERLADLCKKGVITQEEFSAKKTELLARL